MAVLTIIAVLTAFHAVGALHLQNKPKHIKHPTVPDIVIFGVGDSGTRGVKEMLEHLGVVFCHEVNGAGDSMWHIMDYIPSLLKKSGGQVSQAKGYALSKKWDEATDHQAEKSQESWHCAMKDEGYKKKKSLPNDFKWGFKQPKFIYFMPVLDSIFKQKERMLAVARDPRDICTGKNSQQFDTLSGLVKPPAKSHESFRHNGKRGKHEECMKFWSNLWASVLQEYAQSDNFLIVRIEDLVIHKPTTSSKSYDTATCITDYVKLSPSDHELRKELETFHGYEHEYMGHVSHNTRRHMTAKIRKDLEAEVASYTGTPHTVMQALGYNVSTYGLTEPTHPRVFSSGRTQLCK